MYQACSPYSLPKSSSLRAWPVDLSVLWATIVVGLACMTIWLLLNVLLTIYLTQGPRKKGRLISEKSQHSNETLLNGLMQKSKPLTQVLAFEELYLISTEDNYSDRRSAIFDTGTVEASLWHGIVEVCLAKIVESTCVIREVMRSSSRSQVPVPDNGRVTPAQSKPNDKFALPIKVVESNIFQPNTRQAHFYQLKSLPDSVDENQQQIHEVIAYSQTLLQRLWRHLSAWWASLEATTPILKSNVRSQCDKLFAVTPTLELAVLCLENMLIHSIMEDTCGRVHKDVQKILLEFCSLHNLLASYLEVECPNAAQKHTEKPTKIKLALKAAIIRVGLVFQEYIDFPQDLSLLINSSTHDQSR